MSNSDFMKRLQAMREGKEAEIERPSLKERLQKGNPTTAKPIIAKSNESTNAIRARIQEKFKKKSTPSEVLDMESVSEPAEVHQAPPPAQAPQQSGTGPLPQFEMADVPNIEEEEKETTKQWTPENGGVCPSCNTFNNGMMTFCNDCGYLLLSSEQKVEIITAYPLTEIKGLVSTFVKKLDKYQIKTTEDILRVATRSSNRSTLVKRTGMSERSLLRLVHQCDFCRIPSLEPESAAMLELVGITTLEKLKTQSPLNVYKKIQQAKIQLNKQGILFLPTKAKVKSWFEEAEKLPDITIT